MIRLRIPTAFVIPLILALVGLCSVLVSCGGEAQMLLAVRAGSGSDTLPSVRVISSNALVTRTVDLDRSHPTEGPFSTPMSGTIHYEFVLMNHGKETSTRGTLDLPLRSDWRWGVTFQLATEDPTTYCFGCVGSKVFDVDPVLGYDPQVKLYAVWGGNSIKDPVLY